MVAGIGDHVRRARPLLQPWWSTNWAAVRSVARGAAAWIMVGRAALGYTARALTMWAFDDERGLRPRAHLGGGTGLAITVSAPFLSPPIRRSTRVTNWRVSGKGGMPRWRITFCSPAL